MANRLATIRQSDVTRILKGAQAAGVAVGKVVIAPDGSMVIFAAGQAGGDDQTPNPCDRLLDR